MLRVLPTESREDTDHAAIAGAYIRILSVGDRVIHMNFHFVGPGRDPQNLRLIVVLHRLSGLHAIHENERADGRAGDDDFGRSGRRR
jgi:hypothetical protein